MNNDEQDHAKMRARSAPDFDGDRYARYIRAAGTALICVVVIYGAWALLPVAHAIFTVGKSYR